MTRLLLTCSTAVLLLALAAAPAVAGEYLMATYTINGVCWECSMFDRPLVEGREDVYVSFAAGGHRRENLNFRLAEDVSLRVYVGPGESENGYPDEPLALEEFRQAWAIEHQLLGSQGFFESEPSYDHLGEPYYVYLYTTYTQQIRLYGLTPVPEPVTLLTLWAGVCCLPSRFRSRKSRPGKRCPGDPCCRGTRT